MFVEHSIIEWCNHS